MKQSKVYDGIDATSPVIPDTPDITATYRFEITKQQEIDNKKWKMVIYLLLVVIVLLLAVIGVSTVYLVIISNERQMVIKNNNNNMTSIIGVNSIEGLDSYLSAHCILHIDLDDAEAMDINGEGVTVIRNPIDMPSPINIAYSPLLNNVSGKIEYFTNLDPSGNLVAKPKCQTDFDSNSYKMKGNGYVFDKECEFPLPSWMNESDILNLPRRLEAITHRITITTVEVVAELEVGHTFEFFTYNATIPGPPIRVRVGDWIDLILINPAQSAHEHSIDFHGMSGPGGGSVSLRVNPGEEARTIWKAIIPGMFIYHCASGWVSDHISKGMYGAIIVEPEYGLPYSDMDIYLGQNELYLHYPLINNMGTKFAVPPPNIHNRFDPIKERYEMSDVVMLNGAPFGLLHNPIITTVGSVVRAFIVSGGPNILSSFHLIGDHFDRVWLHGDFHTSPQQNIQTTTVPPGGCSVADWRHDTPGNFIFVDHALTRSFVKGNIGIIKACNPNDIGCITGSSGNSIGNKYNCNPMRYNNSSSSSNIDILQSNDDCIFCPWNKVKIGVDINNETDAIYQYLNEECNNNGFNSHNVGWQGDESRHNQTVSNIINDWRKNRYSSGDQWSLSDRLRVADAMVGNPRNNANTDSSDIDEGFDGLPCIVNVGLDGSISIYYVIDRNGNGKISITILRSNLINGGWIAFGRGGDGISAMQDSHIIAILFYDELEMEIMNLFNRGYSTPNVDNSNLKFSVSNESLFITADEISFSFNIFAGNWMSSSSALSTIPMIVAMGDIGDTLEIEEMGKHFDNDIVYFDLVGTHCLFGGDQV